MRIPPSRVCAGTIAAALGFTLACADSTTAPAPPPVVPAEPPAVPVASIDPTPGSIATHPQWPERLDVVLRDALGNTLTGRNVVWTSSNENVATVVAAGNGIARVTGHGIGSATIVASSEGKSTSVPISVTEAAVFAIDILPLSPIISDGSQLQFVAALRDQRGFYLTRPVTWSSSDESVATINATGRASGLRPGETAIIAKSEGSLAAVPFIVRAHVEQVVLTPPTLTLRSGERTQLVATPKDANGVELAGRQVVFSVSKAGVIALDGLGRIYALDSGTVTVTATSEGRSATSVITVIEPVLFVRVTPSFATVPIGSRLQLTATLYDKRGGVITGRETTWTSSNPDVAAVDAGGLVTARTKGVATITITSEGKSTHSQITVP